MYLVFTRMPGESYRRRFVLRISSANYLPCVLIHSCNNYGDMSKIASSVERLSVSTSSGSAAVGHLSAVLLLLRLPCFLPRYNPVCLTGLKALTN